MNIQDKFKIGKRIIISKQPSNWSSLLSNKSPLQHHIIFPYSCIINDIEYYSIDDLNHWAIVDNNGYGWDLSHLINNDIVQLLSKNRCEKIKKIQNYEKY